MEPRDVILPRVQKGELEYHAETTNDYQILCTLFYTLFFSTYLYF